MKRFKSAITGEFVTEEFAKENPKTTVEMTMDNSQAVVENPYRPMTEFPPQEKGEDFSKTVLVFDKDLEDFDLGFYNFDTKKWDVMDGFQMDLICWRHIEKPTSEDVQDYPNYLTD